MLWHAVKELGKALRLFAGYRISQLAGGDIQPESTPARSLPLANPPLSDALIEPVQWRVQKEDRYDPELLNDPLFKIWRGIDGGHKWTHYFETYRAAFESRRSESLRILEIGVLNGAGLKLWKSYFSHPETRILGIDITPSCAKYDAPADGINVRIGSQTDPEFLAQIVREFGPFDLILDDGSHNSSHILASFNNLFIEGLAERGIYLVEDLHTNYWQDWRDTKRSFLDICYEIVEHMHDHYRLAGPQELFVGRPSDHPMSHLLVPRIATLVREVRFFDSIVVIYKHSRPHVPFYLA